MGNLRNLGPLRSPQQLFQTPAPPMLNRVSQMLKQHPGLPQDQLQLSTQLRSRQHPVLRPLNFSGVNLHSQWLPPPSNQSRQMLQWANYLLQTVQDNKYVLGGTQVDFQKGVVHTDCSGLVRTLWKQVGVSLKGLNAAGITQHIQDPKSDFLEISHPAQIQAGDVIGVKMPKADVSGHVMIAWGSPQPIVKNGQVLGYNLRVLDSSSSHSEDQRPHGKNGLGTGIISLKIDPQTGNLTRFYWRANLSGSSWSDVAVGRHIGVSSEKSPQK